MKPITLTRWSIVVRDWLGSDTLRGMSAEAECLFLRLCLDQWERGAARPDKDMWKRSHGYRMHDFDRAWSEAVAAFQVRPEGLVHPRVECDRATSIGEIEAKAHGAKEAAANRNRSQQGRFTTRTSPGVLDVSSSTPPAIHQVSPSSASASASASSVTTSLRSVAAGASDEVADLHPATMNQKPVEPKKPRAPSGPEQTFIATWTRLFVQEVFDETGTPVAYGKLHAGDGPAVARLARERPHEVQDLQLVERRMLALLRSQEAFWLTNRNLRTLCSRWTDIASIPIADHNRRASRPQNAHEETLKNILATRPTHAQENAHGLSGTQRLDQPRDRQALGSLPALQGSARNGHAPAGAVREVHPGRRGPSHLDVAGLLRGIVPVDGPDQPESAR